MSTVPGGGPPWQGGRAAVRKASGDPRTVRRLPDKQVRDRARLEELLDLALVAHVAVPEPAGVSVVPLAIARDGGRLLVHGSTASRAFRVLATGIRTCATVTVLDGVVVARSRFESSMHYRSAMIYGSFTALTDDEQVRGLEVLTERLLPGLTGARPPSAKELAATRVLALPLESWSLKVSDSPPEDAAEDLDRPVWAGVVPLRRLWGTPVAAPDLVVGIDPPAAIAGWPGRA